MSEGAVNVSVSHNDKKSIVYFRQKVAYHERLVVSIHNEVLFPFIWRVRRVHCMRLHSLLKRR